MHTVTLRALARDAVGAALERAAAAGSLPPVTGVRSEVEVSRPAKPEHGDVAANAALRLARPLGMAPPAIAAAIAAALREMEGDRPGASIATVEVAGPGFLNLRFTSAAIEAVVDAARTDPASWGRSRAGADGSS